MEVGIVDYGVGNLFSITNACAAAGLTAEPTSNAGDILSASGLILPGVGAFGDAMALLRQRNLISPLLEFSRSGRPLMGICLGMQLLMSESLEFGRHAGLDIIPGIVTSLALCDQDGSQLKVPNIGWSRVNAVKSDWPDLDSFKGSPLEGLESGEFMYFVHSFHCVPEKADVVVAKSQHGTHEFVCAVRSANVFGYQFHPEKSGPRGLDIYRKFGAMVKRGTSRQEAA